MDSAELVVADSPPLLTDERTPAWRLVLLLAWPALAQQMLHFIVGLSDLFLASFFPLVPLPEQVQAAGWQLMALGRAGHGSPGAGAVSAVAVEASTQAAWSIMGRQVAYQSAQNTANYLIWFISSSTVLVSVGSTALVSRFLGGGERARANRAANQSLLLAALIGLAGTVIGFVCLRPVLALVQLHGAAGQFAVDYLTPVLALLVFQIVEQAGIACLAGAGDTRSGLWVLGGVAVINVPLAWGCFHVWGFAGIALGTAVSHLLGCLAVLTLLARGRAGLRLSVPHLWPDPNLLRRLLWVSVPAGVDSLSIAASQLWFLSIVNQLGDVASTAHGIAIRWEGLAYLSGTAFGVAAMTLIGQNLGAGQRARAAHVGWVAFGLGCAVMNAMAVGFYVLAPEMFGIFCQRAEQADVMRVGVPVLQLVAFATPAMACCIIFSAALRGAGDTLVPVLFTWFGFLAVRIPLAYWLTSGFIGLGLYGAWLAMFADLLVRGALFLARYASGRWQTIQV